MKRSVVDTNNMNNMSRKFDHPIPLTRPTLPNLDRILGFFADSYASGTVTLGQAVSRFEKEICEFTGAEAAVAVSSCTSGLMLAFASLNFPEGSEVILPSFTFPATAQALFWNRLKPVYVDCLPGAMTIDPDEVIKAISRKTVAVCPVTIFGLPPDIGALTDISNRKGIPLIFDSAQGLGSKYEGRPSGSFGLCEVFSLSPTKVITAIEGGVVTTNDSELAEKVRSMRDYGKGPDGEALIFNGLSARMSDLHAAVGLASLQSAEGLINSRLRLIKRYAGNTQRFPGCRAQELPPDRDSTGNYFVLLIERNARADRERVWTALKECGIQSKRYFYPPAQVHPALKELPHRVVGELPNTWSSSQCSLALPLYSHMTDDEQDYVLRVLASILDGAE
jgi:dTDP-4-amino-4,6-dideoxygalactose transaminase